MTHTSDDSAVGGNLISSSSRPRHVHGVCRDLGLVPKFFLSGSHLLPEPSLLAPSLAGAAHFEHTHMHRYVHDYLQMYPPNFLLTR